MIFEKNKELKMIVEVSYDNLQFYSVFQFNNAAFNKVLENGKSVSDFIMSTFSSCKVLKEDLAVKSYRLKIQTSSREFFIFEDWVDNFKVEADKKFLSVEIEAERKKFKTLTAKEIIVLEYNHQGTCKNRINSELNIKPSTFKVHLKSVYKKLDLHSAKDFFKWCERFLLLMKK